MNRAQMTAPFAEEELRTFKGRGGKTMTFIEDETVMDRLDAGYGFGNWQIHVEPIPYAEGVVKVRLGVRDQGEWSWYEDFGYPNQPDGDVLKEAVSDGIRRCGRYVGIARDLYRKSTYEPGGALGPKEARPEPVNHPRPPQSDSGLIGIVEQGDKNTSDFEIRYDPEGIGHLGFRLKGDKGGILVEAAGELAEDLMVSKADLIGSRVTTWGRIEDRSFDTKTGAKAKYQALALERLSFDGVIYPVAKDAPSIPLFDESEEALLDAALTR